MKQPSLLMHDWPQIIWPQFSNKCTEFTSKTNFLSCQVLKPSRINLSLEFSTARYMHGKNQKKNLIKTFILLSTRKQDHQIGQIKHEKHETKPWSHVEYMLMVKGSQILSEINSKWHTFLCFLNLCYCLHN